MVGTVLTLTGLLCPGTRMVNETGEAWNGSDLRSKTRAVHVCRTKYAPRSPCLVTFIKKEPNVYWAICGAANEGG